MIVMMKLIEEVGKKYGRWTVIARAKVFAR
jgi:hypothetical protein